MSNRTPYDPPNQAPQAGQHWQRRRQLQQPAPQHGQRQPLQQAMQTGRMKDFIVAAKSYKPLPQIEAGEHRGRMVPALATTGERNGKPFLFIVVELLDQPHAGRRLTWRLPATVAATPATMDDLARAGIPSLEHLTDSRAAEIELLVLVDVGARGAWIEAAKATGNRLPAPTTEETVGQAAAATEPETDGEEDTPRQPVAITRDLPAHVDPFAPPRAAADDYGDEPDDDDEEDTPRRPADEARQAGEALKLRTRPSTRERTLTQPPDQPRKVSTRKPPTE